MTPEFAIRKFKEQIDNLNSTEFKLWLDTTYTYVEDYFSILSNQSMNFKSLIGDVNIYYAGFPFLQDPKKEKTFKDRAIGYLNSYITYIHEKEKESARIQAEVLKNISINKTMPNQIKENPALSSAPKSKEKINEKTDFHLNISKELFWIISSSIVAATFFLGLYIGQAKFDKEKIEYYENNQVLLKQVSALKIKNDSLLLHNNQITTINKDLEEKYKTSLNSFNEIYQKYNALVNKK